MAVRGGGILTSSFKCCNIIKENTKDKLMSNSVDREIKYFFKHIYCTRN